MIKKIYINIAIIFVILSSCVVYASSIREIDLGEYNADMVVGDTQLLAVALIPAGSDEDVEYDSTNKEVAKINGIGRITALSPGKTTITVKCKDVKQNFELTVKAKKKTVIDVGEYKDKMFVDETQDLSVKVIPETNKTIEYISNRPDIATVDQTGKVKAISKGNVKITISADGISKSITINVEVATESIDVDSTYVILKKGSSYNINANVKPSEAEQNLTYKSSNSDIAAVNETGTIIAKNNGSCFINVSNEDAIIPITVIVNEQGYGLQSEDKSAVEASSNNMQFKQQTIYLDYENHKFLNKDFLKYIYDNNKTVIIKRDIYTITIEGKNIKNWNNELSTDIQINKLDDGNTQIIINDYKNLPGEITVNLFSIYENPKYFYIYNDTIQNFQPVDVSNFTTVKIDMPGKYLITGKNIKAIKINGKFLVGGLIIISFLIIGFLIYKNKYWFW